MLGLQQVGLRGQYHELGFYYDGPKSILLANDGLIKSKKRFLLWLVPAIPVLGLIIKSYKKLK